MSFDYKTTAINAIKNYGQQCYENGMRDAIKQIKYAFLDGEKFYFGCYDNDEHICKEVHCFSCLEEFLNKACEVK